MEENKTKEVNMTPNEKPTYEQLEAICKRLDAQARGLYKQLQEANLSNLYKRLDYLFKVVENSDKFGAEFVVSCVEEIEKAMTIPEETEEEDNK